MYCFTYLFSFWYNSSITCLIFDWLVTGRAFLFLFAIGDFSFLSITSLYCYIKALFWRSGGRDIVFACYALLVWFLEFSWEASHYPEELTAEFLVECGSKLKPPAWPYRKDVFPLDVIPVLRMRWSVLAEKMAVCFVEVDWGWGENIKGSWMSISSWPV